MITCHSDPSAIGILFVGFNFADDAGEANFLAPIVGDVSKFNKMVGISSFHTLFCGDFGTSTDTLSEPT